jgi:hypothetical protein
MAVLFTLLVLLCLVAAGVLGLLAWLKVRRASLLGGPLGKVADLQLGVRKVRGRLVSREPPLVSPVTTRPCVYYRLRVDQERSLETPMIRRGVVRRRGQILRREDYTRTVQYWQNILDTARSTPLLLDDGTGAVAIDLRGAEVIVKTRSRLLADALRPAPPHLHDVLLQRFRIWTVDKTGRGKTLSFQEDLIEEGAKVTVVGPVVEQRDGTLRFDTGAGPLVVSEAGLERESAEARRWAIGLTVGAGASVALGCVCLILAVLVAL